MRYVGVFVAGVLLGVGGLSIGLSMHEDITARSERTNKLKAMTVKLGEIQKDMDMVTVNELSTKGEALYNSDIAEEEVFISFYNDYAKYMDLSNSERHRIAYTAKLILLQTADFNVKSWNYDNPRGGILFVGEYVD